MKLNFERINSHKAESDYDSDNFFFIKVHVKCSGEKTASKQTQT